MLVQLVRQLFIRCRSIRLIVYRAAAVHYIYAALRQAKDVFQVCAAIPAYLYIGLNIAYQSYLFELHQASRTAVVAQVTTKYQYMVGVFYIRLHRYGYRRF